MSNDKSWIGRQRQTILQGRRRNCVCTKLETRNQLSLVKTHIERVKSRGSCVQLINNRQRTSRLMIYLKDSKKLESEVGCICMQRQALKKQTPPCRTLALWLNPINWGWGWRLSNRAAIGAQTLEAMRRLVRKLHETRPSPPSCMQLGISGDFFLVGPRLASALRDCSECLALFSMRPRSWILLRVLWEPVGLQLITPVAPLTSPARVVRRHSTPLSPPSSIPPGITVQGWCDSGSPDRQIGPLHSAGASRFPAFCSVAPEQPRAGHAECHSATPPRLHAQAQSPDWPRLDLR